MNYLLKRSTTLLCKMKLAIAAVSTLFVAKANAQITFGSLYYQNASGTAFNTGSAIVLNTTGTASTPAWNLKGSNAGTPMAVIADNEGNVAFAYSLNHLMMIPKGTNKLLYLKEATPGAKPTGLAFDNQEEFLYATVEGAGIRKFLWKNINNAASIKNIAATKNVGDAITMGGAGFSYVPFLPYSKDGSGNPNGAKVFLNGQTDPSQRQFIVMPRPKGLVFDAAGNLYYVDAENSTSTIYVRRINIVNRTATGTVATNSLTLNSVAGLKIGDLVSGLSIPEKTYIGTIAGNTITLVDIDGANRNLLADVDNQTSIAIITGVDNIVGTGSAGKGAVPAVGSAVALNFQTSGSQNPTGMAFDAAGNLYFADQNNKRILKVEKDGTGKISSASQVTSLLTADTPGSRTSGIVIRGNDLYFTDGGTNCVYKTSLSGATPQVIAGNGGRLNVRGTSTAGSTTIQLVDGTGNGNVALPDSYWNYLTKIKVGMTLRGDGDIVFGTRVASVNAANHTFELEDNALAAKVNDGANTTGVNMIFSSEDGFVTEGVGTGENTGYLDAPAGLSLVNHSGDAGFDLYVAENGGYNVRILSNVNILPVTLSGEFKAKLNTSGHVNLIWATASEQNNDRFILKRSTDGVNYTVIDNQVSKGDQGASYMYTDVKPAVGVNYYSLSQIDKDGTVKELGIKSVNVAVATSGKVLTIYPNPVTGITFTLQTEVNTSTLAISIKNLQGKEVWAKQISKTADGTYQITLDHKLSAGIYVLTVNGSTAQKLIVQ